MIDEKTLKNYEQRKVYFLMPVQEMKNYVAATFDVRHNVVTDVYEFRRKETDEAWRPLDERGFNTIACGIEEANIFCLDSRIKHWLRSPSGSGWTRYVASGTARTAPPTC